MTTILSGMWWLAPILSTVILRQVLNTPILSFQEVPILSIMVFGWSEVNTHSQCIWMVSTHSHSTGCSPWHPFSHCNWLLADTNSHCFRVVTLNTHSQESILRVFGRYQHPFGWGQNLTIETRRREECLSLLDRSSHKMFLEETNYPLSLQEELEWSFWDSSHTTTYSPLLLKIHPLPTSWNCCWYEDFTTYSAHLTRSFRILSWKIQ